MLGWWLLIISPVHLPSYNMPPATQGQFPKPRASYSRCAFSTLLSLKILVAGLTSPAAAQVTPDRTLGAESSQLTLNGVTIDAAVADLIRGGARRGNNVFHSFERFSVGEGRRVYFENPAGVARVFGRVTGDLRSDILGTLGVAGGADLFLLNPNGIVFGPNAQLDIAGSFVASTADRFTFADGAAFNAIAPESSLLTVNVPLGVQFNNQPQNRPQGNLINQANLAVGPGQSLTLFGNVVTSSVALTAPDGNVQVLGNQVELVDRAGAMEPGGNTNLLVAAADGITIADVTDDALLFAPGTGEVVLRADANASGEGNITMLDRQDTLQTNGRNLTLFGNSLSLGALNTTAAPQSASRESGAVAITAGDITVSGIDASSVGGDGGNLP